ncbi:BCCT family transporter [Metabacillus sp. 84]|uniref:BCCT family transporter n=1 Tax=Metabacillus sp. 84 TaxID=3404705 RepID=UPI003CF866D3
MRKFTPMFWIAISMGAIFVGWGALFPNNLLEVMTGIKTLFLDKFGWFYQFSASFFIIAAIIIAFSRYGKIRLGKDEDRPEYSTPTWFAMLFSAGMGIGLLFYGVSEPASHFSTPPFGDGGTEESARVSLRYTYLHWGFHAWAIYAVVALALAYYKFRKGLPGLMSATLYPLIGEKTKGPIGYAVDIIAVFATLFGVAISLGIGAQQINSGFNYLFGWPVNFTTQLIIMGFTTILFIYSAASGLSKGIKYLSNTNMFLAVLLFFAFLFLGPTQFVLELFSTTFGSYVQNLPSMGLRFSPFNQEDNQWVKDWTIFYWAWWISWTPFVGTFIARVSKGRTVREFILAVIIAPTLVCSLWFGVFGGTGLYFELIQGADVSGQSLETALFYVYKLMPFGTVLTIISLLLITTFFVTSADSATYVLGMQTSNGSLNPPTLVKVSWGLIMAAIAAILMGTGGVEGLQAATIISALPLGIILIFMTAALFKSFQTELSSAKKEKENVEETASHKKAQ